MVTIEIHKVLSSLYEKRKDNKKALKHFKKFHNVHESVFNEQSNTRIKQMQIRMEIEKSEKEAEDKENKYKEMIEITLLKKLIM